nr:MAG TPA: hypothetical protein [Bacteriophage sp.]
MIYSISYEIYVQKSYSSLYVRVLNEILFEVCLFTYTLLIYASVSRGSA